MVWNNPERFQKNFKFKSAISVAKFPKYEDRVKEDRLERKAEKNKIATEFLAKAIDFYGNSIKDTLIKIDPDKTLNQNLDALTESQLFEVNLILKYIHEIRPFNRNELSRMITSVPDQTIIHRIIHKIQNRIPAFKLRLELEKLETQESEIEKRKIVVQGQINQVIDSND